MDMSLSEPWELVMDAREAWHAADHGVAKLDMTERLNWTELKTNICVSVPKCFQISVLISTTLWSYDFYVYQMRFWDVFVLLGLNLKYADTYDVLPSTDDNDDDKYSLYLLRHFTWQAPSWVVYYPIWQYN